MASDLPAGQGPPDDPDDTPNDPSGEPAGQAFGSGDVLRSTKAVPIFPLPNVVLFPHAVLPLHIFEPRYRQMTADALAGDAQIAMCLLKPGQDPMDDRPPVFDVGCVATILDHQRLADGRYNLLLQGTCRVRLVQEVTGKCYRRANLTPLVESDVLEIDLDEQRTRMASIFRRPPIHGTPPGAQLQKIIAGPTPTSRLADVVAFELLDDVAIKQRLLGECDVRRRVEQIVAVLDEQYPAPDSVRTLSNRFTTEDED